MGMPMPGTDASRGPVRARVVAAAVAVFATTHALAEEPDPAPAEAGLVVHATTTDGSPVAGARVEVRSVPPAVLANGAERPLDRDVIAHGTSDARGRVRVCAAASAAWHVLVSADGRANEMHVVRPVPGWDRALDVTLRPGHVLRGVVTQEGDAPVTDAVVFAGPLGFEGKAPAIVAQARTDAEGRFVLAGLPAGATDVWAERPRSGPRFFARVAVPGVPEIELYFPRGVRVFGVVREDYTDKPVPGVTLRYEGLGGSRPQAVSGPDGRYELWTYAGFIMSGGLEVGPAPWELVSVGKHGGDGSGGLPRLIGSESEERDVVVQRKWPPDESPRPEPVEVEVVATDRGGAPYPGLLVGVRGTDAWGLADGSGRLRLHLPEERVDEIRAGTDALTLVARRRTDDGGVSLVLVPTRRCGVRVVGEDGAPVAGARVVFGDVEAWERRSWFHVTPGPVEPRYAWTDADGVATVPRTERPSRVQVRVTAPGFADTSADVAALREDRADTVVLRRERPVRVRVIDARTERPVARAWLRLSPPDDDGSRLPYAGARGPVWCGRTDADGVFVLRGHAEGTLRVTAWDVAHHEESAPVDLATDDELAVRMSPHLSIAGRLVWPEGVAVERASIWVVSPDPVVTWVMNAGSEPDGNFEITGLREGRYELLVYPGDGVDVAPERFGPFDADTAGLELVAHRARTVRGGIVRPDGSPVAGAEVAVAPPDRFLHPVAAETRTDAEGRFETSGAPFGPLAVRMRHDAWGPAGKDRRIHVWEVGDVGEEELSLSVDPDLVIAGRVLSGETGEPVAGATVIALPDHVADPEWVDTDFECSAVVTDASGRFRIEGLAPGRYRIWFEPALRYVGPPVEPYPLDPDPGTDAGTTGVECRRRW